MAQQNWLLPAVALAGLGAIAFYAMKDDEEPLVKGEWDEEIGEEEPESGMLKAGMPMIGFDPFNPWGFFGLIVPEEAEEPEDVPAGEALAPHGVKRQWPKKGNPPKPMMVGNPKDPEVAAVLQELDDYLDAYGVGEYTSAKELTTMPKAPGMPVAIPPYKLWPNMISTLRIWQPIREKLGFPMSLRGYRPPDYNEAVGGSPTSAHMWFSTLDIRPGVYSSTNRKNLALEGAKVYVDRGDELKIGFGAYGETPTNIHLDTHRRAKHTWKSGQYFIDQV